MYTSGPCSVGCGHDESVDRLFVGYAYFGSVVAQILLWLGIFMEVRLSISSHFNQFTNLDGDYKKFQFSLHVIWMVSVWVI